LDISAQTVLAELYCDGNQLTSLNTSNNAALSVLWCNSNQLSALDVSNNLALTVLQCNMNLLTSINTSNNTMLTSLGCTGNGINYAEFLVESFSTFGMYAKHKNGPLPVTLTTFNANCQGDHVVINWTTASEFNASHYTIQSCRDGCTWQDLGEIEAAGTTNQNTNYSFQTQNFGSLTYFRLVQVDLDGATEIFGPISSNCDIENNSMTVFPNPTADNFTVRIEATQSFENATLELVDMTGRVIMNKTTDINAGSTLLNFNGADLKAGTYFVRMKGENDPFAPVRAVRM